MQKWSGRSSCRVESSCNLRRRCWSGSLNWLSRACLLLPYLCLLLLQQRTYQSRHFISCFDSVGASASTALTSAIGESPGGISLPGAPRTVREPLDSHGSRCSAGEMHQRLCLSLGAPPVTGWLQAWAEQRGPFGPVPLQDLHPYYEPLRPCAPHRYSDPCGFSRLDHSLGIGTTGSHVPYKSLVQLRAACMPDAARAAFRKPPNRSREMA